ncbi:class I SAM-dependent methyltransferase [Thalassobacillus devorans]|uniref:class I SAM-dependent methyltransferase n=1 Tax=Thalassobacillus devorans TaxID=279813 RepID=UPI0031329A78
MDLGAGNGYLTLPIAKATKGRVTAVDIQPEMFEMVAERAEKEGLYTLGKFNFVKGLKYKKILRLSP